MPTSTLWTIPNQLTLSRFFLAAVHIALIHFEQWAWCLVVFVLAAFTDWLDGYLARIWNQGSALGRVLDPLADKVLNMGAFIFLLPLGTREGWLTPWMVTVVICRELIITGLRSSLEAAGAKFGADWAGKLKMVLQCLALAAIFIAAMVPSLALTRDLLIWGMLLATVASGVQYLVKAARLGSSTV
jgi:CDP-diacylglycerol--glycerol-3-phosphate 3-phosphatidyltransferase